MPATAQPDSEPHRWGLAEVGLAWVVSFFVSALFAATIATIGRRPGAGAGAALAGALDGERHSAVETADLLGLALTQAPLWAMLTGSFALIALVLSVRPVTEFGLARPGLEVPAGVAIGVAAQVAVWVLYEMATLVIDFDVGDRAAKLVGRASGVGVLALLVLLALIGPFVEELFYRGLVLTALRRLMSDRLALVTSALFFAAIHLQVVEFPGLVLAGLVFGYLYVCTGRLAAAVAAHVGFNASTIIWLAVSS